MKKNILFIAIVIGIMLGTGASLLWNAFTSTQSSVATKPTPSPEAQIIIEVFSDPVMMKHRGKEEVSAQSGMVVTQGTIINTGPSGRAQIVFPNGTVTRLDAQTEVELKESSFLPQQIHVQVNKGFIWSRVAKMGSDEYYRTSSTDVATSVKGTSYGHQKVDNGVDYVITTKGEVIGTCLYEKDEGVITKDTKKVFNCKDGEQTTPEPLTDEDRVNDFIRFNQQEDETLNQRFGPYAYGDHDEDVLGVDEQADRNPVQRLFGVIGRALGFADDTSTTENDGQTEQNTSQNNDQDQSPVNATDNSNDANGTNDSETNTDSDSPEPTDPLQKEENPNESNPLTGNTPFPTIVKPTDAQPVKPKKQTIAKLKITSEGDKVYVTPEEGAQEVPATPGMAIHEGSTVRTENARAEIEFPNGSVTRLDEHTQVTVVSRSEETFDISVLLDAGRIWSRIKKLTGSDEGGSESYDTRTESMVATVRGTAYGHEIEEENGELVDKIMTIEGRVEGTCLQSGENKLTQGVEEVTPVERAQKGIFRCNSNQPRVKKSDLAALEEDDALWILANMIKDQELEDKNQGIQYYEDGEDPISMFDESIDLLTHVEENMEITINTDTEVALNEILELEAEITYQDYIDQKPELVWSVLDHPQSPSCQGIANGRCLFLSPQTESPTYATFMKEGVYRIGVFASIPGIDGLVKMSDVIITVKGQINLNAQGQVTSDTTSSQPDIAADLTYETVDGQIRTVSVDEEAEMTIQYDSSVTATPTAQLALTVTDQGFHPLQFYLPYMPEWQFFASRANGEAGLLRFHPDALKFDLQSDASVTYLSEDHRHIITTISKGDQQQAANIISGQITVKSEVQFDEPGTYAFEYSAQDIDSDTPGNQGGTAGMFTIKLIDVHQNKPPEVSLSSPDIKDDGAISLELNDDGTWQEQTLTVTADIDDDGFPAEASNMWSIRSSDTNQSDTECIVPTTPIDNRDSVTVSIRCPGSFLITSTVSDTLSESTQELPITVVPAQKSPQMSYDLIEPEEEGQAHTLRMKLSYIQQFAKLDYEITYLCENDEENTCNDSKEAIRSQDVAIDGTTFEKTFELKTSSAGEDVIHDDPSDIGITIKLYRNESDDVPSDQIMINQSSSDRNEKDEDEEEDDQDKRKAPEIKKVAFQDPEQIGFEDMMFPGVPQPMPVIEYSVKGSLRIPSVVANPIEQITISNDQGQHLPGVFSNTGANVEVSFSEIHVPAIPGSQTSFDLLVTFESGHEYVIEDAITITN